MAEYRCDYCNEILETDHIEDFECAACNAIVCDKDECHGKHRRGE